MPNDHKISLFTAIFININIMLGSGIFINSTVLAQQAGVLGAFCYALVGLLMLPLIISITKLLALHPSGGFYTFGAQEIHPYAGFLSAWSYATGKLASAVIITQFAVILLQQVIPLLSSFNPLVLNSMIMGFFILLNMLDIKTSSSIQTVFFGLKTIPILFGIFVGLYLFSGSNFTAQPISFEGIPVALPLVLFALAGFEAACSLSSRIENAQKNAPLAVFISYAVVICTTTLFQLMIYGALGSTLAALPDYRMLFPTLIANILPAGSLLANSMTNLIHLAIAASALGGSYGVIFSNSWNFYTLAQHNHLWGSSQLVRFNRFQIPWLCVIAEAIIYFLFLIVSRGNQIPLQQIGAVGPTISYSISALSLFYAYRSGTPGNTLLPIIALGSCSLLFAAGVYSLIVYGMGSLILFGSLSIVGSIMFWSTFNPSTST